MGRAWGLEARAWPLDDSDVGPPTLFLLHIMTHPTRSRCKNPPDHCLTPLARLSFVVPRLWAHGGPASQGMWMQMPPHRAPTPALPC